MYIGNIITNSKVDNPNFKVCRKIETIKKELPTLIVGWETVKEIYGDKVSILHKKIDDNTFWTFSAKERLVDYEKDLKKFESDCYDLVGNDITYVYVDPIHDSRKKIKKIIKKLFSLTSPKIYIHNDRMIYIYSENLIFGIDTEITDYIGIDKDKLINKLKKLSNSLLLNNEIFNKYTDVMTNIKKFRLIPYLYDIEINE